MNEAKFDSPDVVRTTFAVLSMGMLIAASFWILSPFIIAIIWATVIVVATWPLLLGIQARLWGKRGLAVALMTVTLLLIIVGFFSLIVAGVVGQAAEISTLVKSLATYKPPPPPEWVVGIPLVGPKLVDRWQQFAALGPQELSARLAPYARQAAGWLIATAGSIGMMIVQFLLTVTIAAIFYAKGEAVAAGICKFARRLAGQRGEEAAVLAAKAARGVALGVGVTAIMQAALGGIGLVITGVPAAALLTGVLFILCLAQIGPALVLVPAVVWLFWKEGALWGGVLLVFSILAVTLDNFVRPLLIKKGTDLPLIMIFTGVIGGLIAFGVIGLFVGPVVLAVTFTLLKAWISDEGRQEAAAPYGK